MNTPLQQLIEQIKKMPAYEFEPVVIGIVEKAESLLPVEEDSARSVFEEGVDLGYELAGLHMGGKTIEDNEVHYGLTKREHFAAMAKTPDAILLGLVDAWKGDGGSLPLWNDVMIKQFAKLEAEYKVAAADALIEALNKPPTNEP